MDLQREFRVGEWRVQPLRGSLSGPEDVRRLTPKAMDVLFSLAQWPGEVVARELLLRRVWGERAVTDEPLTRCIAELRRQLGDERAAPRYIETIPKRGYRLVAKVETAESADDTGHAPSPPAKMPGSWRSQPSSRAACATPASECGSPRKS